MTANQSGTFSYAPDIACSIYTTSGVLDVSQDIIDLTVTRTIGGVSQVNMDLANPGKKYNRVINTMDRIVVFLKRTDWVQVFTGYVTFAPIETLIPTSVNIAADCTIRILQNTYWDDTLQQFQQLFLNSMDYAAASSDATVADGGVAQAIVNLLVTVCGWSPDKIHIQGIPHGLLVLASKAYKNIVNGVPQNSIDELAGILGSSAYIAGNSTSTGSSDNTTKQKVAGNNTGVGSPPGVEFTANYVQAFYTHPLGNGAKENYPGSNVNNPVTLDGINHDPYWAAMPFTYATFASNSGNQISNAKTWISQDWPYGNKNDKDANLRGRLLLVTNVNTNRAIALRAAALVQKPNKVGKDNHAVINRDIANIDYIQVHPGVAAYLAGSIGENDIKNFGKNHTGKPLTIPAFMHWADESTVRKPGPQKKIEQATTAAKTAALGGSQAVPSVPVKYEQAQQAVIDFALSQIGAQYSQGLAGDKRNYYGGKLKGHEETKTANSPGYFDCSGLMQWAYSKIGITIGGDTVSQWGTGSDQDNHTHGYWLPPSVKPEPGDLLFWDDPTDAKHPGHVSMLTKSIGKNGIGKQVQAWQWHLTVSETDFDWNKVNSNNDPAYIRATEGLKTYVGARRPLFIKHPDRTYTFPQTTDVANRSQGTNPTNQGSSILSLAGSFNMLMNPPTFDVRASVMLGTARAFLLDNNVLSDFQQIVGAGLRTFMSAPNGDFVCWTPDYYGFYGTDPVLEISQVEIVDFQIYHDDNQLVTHYGIIGDSGGIGQQVSMGDYYTTNGIVSIEDGATMNILFGKLSQGQSYANAANNFLQRYGLRPMAKEQNMIHSHAMEYIYALKGFMDQWVAQYASTISLTFLPELYPGMRVTMNIDNEDGGSDNYQFYCTGVTHQCSRVGGFTTQATFTAPVKNGNILDYGLGLL